MQNNNSVTDSAIVSIRVQGVNDAPSMDAASYSFTLQENSADGTVVGTVSATDVEGAPLVLSSADAGPAFAVSASGQITVLDSSQINYPSTGSYVLQVQASDGSAASALATVTIHINHAPTAVAPALTHVNHGQTITGIDPLVGSNDADADALSVTTEAYPSKGSLSWTGLTYAYTAYVNSTGLDSFQFALNDGNGGVSQPVTVFLYIDNTAPVAADQVVAVSAGATVSGINPFLGASDQESDALTVTTQTNPQGTLTWNGSTYTYTAGATATGIDFFRFKLHDGAADSNLATIFINIGAATVTDTTDQYTAKSVNAFPSANPNNTFTLLAPPAKGIVTNNNDGTFTLDPGGDFMYLTGGQTANATFACTMTDSANVTTSVLVTVTVSGLSLAPPKVNVIHAMDGFQSVDDGRFLLYRDVASGALTVNYVLAQRASQTEADSTDTTGQATFAAGDYYTEVVISSSAVSSDGADMNYTLQVRDQGSSYRAGDLFYASLTIRAQAKVWIDSVQNAVEGVSTGYFRLKRTSTTGELTVSYILDSGPTSAVEGTQFAPLPGYVTFADGNQYADVVIDPTGQYADPNMPSDKTVAIQLTGLNATALAGGKNWLLISAPAAPAGPAPSFVNPAVAGEPAATAYEFWAGEGLPGVNQQLKTPWGWIGQVKATGAVQYSITGGVNAGYFQINNDGNNKGWISPARDLPKIAAVYNLTVTATASGGATNSIAVTIRVVPWVYLTGDLQGVKVSINNQRDRIRLDLVRVASVAELQAPLTVDYAVNWNTTTRDDLENAANLVAVGAANGSKTFAANVGKISIELTPSDRAPTTDMQTFTVALVNQPGAFGYAVMTPHAVRLDDERNWGEGSVTCTIFPMTTLFASDNADPVLRDAVADGGVNFNDIKQGEIGDCFFLADLAALAKSNPAAIQNMFTDLGGGRYRVTFYNYGNLAAQTVEVDMDLTHGISQAKFQGDFNKGAGYVSSYEIWPQILEKAYSRYMGRAGFVNGLVGFPGGPAWPALPAVGSTCATMTRLTGQRATETDMYALGAAQLAAVLAGMILDLNANIPVAVIEVDGGHAWAVTGYDATTNEFLVYNPHGYERRRTHSALLAEFRWAIRLQ